MQEGGEEMSKEAMKRLPTFNQDERSRELVEFSADCEDCFFCDEEVCVFCFIVLIVVSVDVAD